VSNQGGREEVRGGEREGERLQYTAVLGGGGGGVAPHLTPRIISLPASVAVTSKHFGSVS
jgi:hypothetical protein